MTLTSKILSILIAALALAACGQSGPLYVPGDPSSVQQPQPVPEADENGDENSEDDEG
jgi:predicted small lipoprotein YifL